MSPRAACTLGKEARIFAVVDVFDALTSARPYKQAQPLEESLARIESEAGGHFDPAVVAAFLPLAPELHRATRGADEERLQTLLLTTAARHFPELRSR